jgi:hypothetical protein
MKFGLIRIISQLDKMSRLPHLPYAIMMEIHMVSLKIPRLVVTMKLPGEA